MWLLIAQLALGLLLYYASIGVFFGMISNYWSLCSLFKKVHRALNQEMHFNKVVTKLSWILLFFVNRFKGFSLVMSLSENSFYLPLFFLPSPLFLQHFCILAGLTIIPLVDTSRHFVGVLHFRTVQIGQNCKLGHFRSDHSEYFYSNIFASFTFAWLF